MTWIHKVWECKYKACAERIFFCDWFQFYFELFYSKNYPLSIEFHWSWRDEQKSSHQRIVEVHLQMFKLRFELSNFSFNFLNFNYISDKSWQSSNIVKIQKFCLIKFIKIKIKQNHKTKKNSIFHFLNINYQKRDTKIISIIFLKI